MRPAQLDITLLERIFECATADYPSTTIPDPLTGIANVVVESPAIAFTRMYNRKIFPINILKSQGIRRFVFFMQHQIQINCDIFSFILKFKQIQTETPHPQPVFDLHRIITDYDRID